MVSKFDVDFGTPQREGERVTLEAVFLTLTGRSLRD